MGETNAKNSEIRRPKESDQDARESSKIVLQIQDQISNTSLFDQNNLLVQIPKATVAQASYPSGNALRFGLWNNECCPSPHGKGVLLILMYSTGTNSGL